MTQNVSVKSFLGGGGQGEESSESGVAEQEYWMTSATGGQWMAERTHRQTQGDRIDRDILHPSTHPPAAKIIAMVTNNTARHSTCECIVYVKVKGQSRAILEWVWGLR